MKKIYMYVFDTISNHEYGYLFQILTLQKMLNKTEYEICTVGLNKEPIKTLGGMTIVPDITIEEVDKESTVAFILIGGDTWTESIHDRVLDYVVDFIDKGVLIAAICGATLGLANKGILNNRKHTSNALFYLTGMSNNYTGQDFYVDKPVVCEGNLITASSAGVLEWTKAIAEKLEIFSKETLEVWFKYFSTAELRYYADLIESFGK